MLHKATTTQTLSSREISMLKGETARVCTGSSRCTRANRITMLSSTRHQAIREEAMFPGSKCLSSKISIQCTSTTRTSLLRATAHLARELSQAITQAQPPARAPSSFTIHPEVAPICNCSDNSEIRKDLPKTYTHTLFLSLIHISEPTRPY